MVFCVASAGLLQTVSVLVSVMMSVVVMRKVSVLVSYEAILFLSIGSASVSASVCVWRSLSYSVQVSALLLAGFLVSRSGRSSC